MLKKTARPMIRFRTGDIISFNFEPCRCGLIFHVSEETFSIRLVSSEQISQGFGHAAIMTLFFPTH